MEKDEKSNKEIEIRHTTSTFRFLASHHFTGLACVFIDHGVDVMSAFRDCISQGEYQMALTLLRKTPAHRVAELRDEQKNTLITYVCEHSSNSSDFQDKFCGSMLRTLYEEYRLPLNTVSAQNETHLHQTCWSGAFAAFDRVLSTCDVNAHRQDGFDALSLTIIGKSAPQNRLKMVERLLAAGADVDYIDVLRNKAEQSSIFTNEDDRKTINEFARTPVLLFLLKEALSKLKKQASVSTPDQERLPDMTGDSVINDWLRDSLPYVSSPTNNAVYASVAIAALLIKAGLNWHHLTDTGGTAIEVMSNFNIPANFFFSLH